MSKAAGPSAGRRRRRRHLLLLLLLFFSPLREFRCPPFAAEVPFTAVLGLRGRGGAITQAAPLPGFRPDPGFPRRANATDPSASFRRGAAAAAGEASLRRRPPCLPALPGDQHQTHHLLGRREKRGRERVRSQRPPQAGGPPRRSGVARSVPPEQFLRLPSQVAARRSGRAPFPPFLKSAAHAPFPCAAEGAEIQTAHSPRSRWGSNGAAGQAGNWSRAATAAASLISAPHAGARADISTSGRAPLQLERLRNFIRPRKGRARGRERSVTSLRQNPAPSPSSC